MKRHLSVLLLGLCLATPAHAIAPLAALVLHYVKDAIRQQVVGMVKDKVAEYVPGGQYIAPFIGGGRPAGGMMGMAGGGGMGAMAQSPEMAARMAEANRQLAALRAGDAAPLSEAEWTELAALMRAAAPEGDPPPDLSAMRASMQGFPGMAGIMRNTIVQLREADKHRAEAFAAYGKMSEAERNEVMTAFAAEVRQLDPEERKAYIEALEDGSAKMPGDLGARLVAALRAS